VSAVPDIASLNFGMQTGRQKSAEAAMRMLTEKIESVFDAVKETGVEEKDVRTRNLSLNPAYDWNEGKRIDRGFEASQSLTVKVRDLSKISDVLDAAVKAGANQAGSVSFTIDDPEELRAQAREAAIADAKEKALVLADQLGVSLVKFNGFWEDGGMGQPVYMERTMMMDSMEAGMGGAAPPLPAGEQEVRITVNMTYEVR
jgi:hypothetical protein